MANICTLADVKNRLTISDTEYDVLLDGIITGVDAIFDSRTHRTLIAPGSDVTEYFTGCGNYLQLNLYPLIGITSIKESMFYDFDSSVERVADTDYRVMNNGKNGILYRINNHWLDSPDSIQIVYRGGYSAAGVIPGPGEHAMPDDLREAAIQQVCLIFKRRDDIGLSAVGFEGGSISKFSKIELLPMVKDTLNNYMRVLQ